MPARTAVRKRFRATIDGAEKGRVYVTLPFDPADVWGPRTTYHVTGAINDVGVRGALVPSASGYFLPLGPAWRKGAGVAPGDKAQVELGPEGPQRDDLAPDLAAALDADSAAADAFDSLATFYRKNILRWIDATKRRPEVRAERIADVVRKLKAGPPAEAEERVR